MTIEDKLNNLAKMREQACQGGGAKRIESQHAKKKLTARERINLLFDPGTFEEIDTFVMHRTSDFGLDKERGKLRDSQLRLLKIDERLNELGRMKP